VRILKTTQIDFLKQQKLWIGISLAFIAIGIVSLVAKGGPNLGIDFTGGTQIVYGFSTTPDEDAIRKVVEGAGVKVETVQRFDRPEKNQVRLRVPQEKEGRDVSGELTTALTKALFPQGAAPGTFDLNLNGADALQRKLMEADPEKLASRPNADPKTEYGRTAAAIVGARSAQGLFRSIDDAAKTPGVSPAVASFLKEKTVTGPLILLNAESVGPQVGQDLRQKGMWAIILSWAAMLTYIAVRFRSWSFGIAAVVSLIHDTLVTLGICSLLNVEISLTVVASFLTLIGYSVNDTVVIFDRIRENMPKMKRTPLRDIVNLSVNQTLSRTLLTSALTFLVVVSLFVFGGEVLRGFSFVLVVGLIVGSYSTIFIASPIVIAWENWRSRRRGNGQPVPAKGKPEAAAPLPKKSAAAKAR
jgi:preprotein translocase subunit SecF